MRNRPARRNDRRGQDRKTRRGVCHSRFSRHAGVPWGAQVRASFMKQASPSESTPTHGNSVTLSNAEIANRLTSLAQLLSTRGENPFKVKAYRWAAETIGDLSQSVDEQVRSGGDLTAIPGIGKGIAGAVREIVLSGTLRMLESLRTEVGPEIAALSEYPRLDPKRVLRIYKKLEISTVEALKEKLQTGEVEKELGVGMAHHVRAALSEANEVLLYDADPVVAEIQRFLAGTGKVKRAVATGDYRRRVEVLSGISFLIQTDDFPDVVEKFQSYGGKSERLSASETRAMFKLPSRLILTVENASKAKWGLAELFATGSDEHLEKLQKATMPLKKLATSKDSFPSEDSVYQKLGLAFIEPELREGRDEVELAATDALPVLVDVKDIRGELHAHSTSSDGAHEIEEMVEDAQRRGYEYLGITDHSQSLKIANGVSEADLKKQIRRIDKLNAKLEGFRILKSAEVDILADGSLDYPDELLQELDYTVCSIHSRFQLGKDAQTERLMRAMDNPHFTILGHATGRKLLRRPGYEFDMERVIEHAHQRGCFFEINASPDRLDLSVANARLVHDAGIKIAINTDAHHIDEFDFIRCGVDQARRAGLEKTDILNCLSWAKLEMLFRRRK
jgi:DNA polymerase (family 10)